MDKKASRQRRARKARAKIRELGRARLCIHRTPRHIYAQIIDESGDKVLASASTLDRELRKDMKATGNADAAAIEAQVVRDGGGADPGHAGAPGGFVERHEVPRVVEVMRSSRLLTSVIRVG